jgi:hypothetical protein
VLITHSIQRIISFTPCDPPGLDTIAGGSGTMWIYRSFLTVYFIGHRYMIQLKQGFLLRMHLPAVKGYWLNWLWF